jgi:hypothetical protein
MQAELALKEMSPQHHAPPANGSKAREFSVNQETDLIGRNYHHHGWIAFHPHLGS